MHRMLNRLACKCAKKENHTNKIAQFGDLNFFKIILNELRVKCVTRFGRFGRILEDPWKW